MFSHSVMSDSLQPHGLQRVRLPCLSLSPRVCSNSCLLSWWCYLTISSSASPFFCPQSFPASGSFPMSWLFASGGQITGASASKTDLPMNVKGWVFPKYWITLIPYSACSPDDSEPLPYWKPALGQSRPNVELRKPTAQACRICPGVWERPLLLD